MDSRYSSVVGDAQGDLVVIWKHYKHLDYEKAIETAINTVNRFSKREVNWDHLRGRLYCAWTADVKKGVKTDFGFIKEVIGQTL